ncbi:MAG: DHH family phosphoesterase [Patescibacteria group bacterium]
MVDPALWNIVQRTITAARAILVLNPKDSDGDSIGASLALGHYFRSLGKRYRIFTAKPPSPQLAFLPGFSEISADFGQLRLAEYDLVIGVDFADLKMLAFSEPLLAELKTKMFINIDHHATNFRFGTINIIVPEAAATTEILYHFFETQNIPYDKNVATCLLMGIVYDTGSFAHLNTTRSVVEISSNLLLRGARLKTITRQTTAKSLPTLRLWGLALSRLTHNARLGLSTTIILQKDLIDLKADEEATEGIANFLNNLAGPKAILVLKEEPNSVIKGSLRSTQPGINVANLAERLGGGGHKKAAGFTLHGRLVREGNTWQVR